MWCLKVITRATCGSQSLGFGSFFFLYRDMWPRSCNYIILIGFANLRGANFHAPFLICLTGSKCAYLDITYLLISIKMWLASILIINTLSMLTIAHADRGRPTLTDDERFRNGYFHDFKIRTLMCTRSILCKNSRLNVLIHRTEKCCSNHSNAVNWITQMLWMHTKNVCDVSQLWTTSDR